MAKGRKKNDNVLLYSVLGVFSVLIILVVALVVSANAQQEDPNEDLLEYDEFQHLTNFDVLDDQDEDVYAVYYYQVNCGACASIKQDVLEMVQDNNSDLKIYLMDAAARPSGNKDLIILDGEVIRYTPTMLVYRDGELVEMHVSGESIRPFIDDVESGIYSN